MIMLLTFLMAGLGHADSVEITTLIASRAKQEALVLVESSAGYAFLRCPYVPNVLAGTSVVAPNELWRKCKQIGRAIRGEEDLDQVLEQFSDRVSKHVTATLEFSAAPPGKKLILVPVNLAMAWPFGLVAGLTRYVGAQVRLTPVQELRRTALKTGVVTWLIAATAFQAFEALGIYAANLALPTAQFVNGHAAEVRAGQTLVIENGRGSGTGFYVVLGILKKVLRDTTPH